MEYVLYFCIGWFTFQLIFKSIEYLSRPKTIIEKVLIKPEIYYHSSDSTSLILEFIYEDGEKLLKRLNKQQIIGKTDWSTSKETSSIYHVLGIMPTTDKTTVNSGFKRMAMIYHPDHGGTSAAFQTLVKAKEKALLKCKG